MVSRYIWDVDTAGSIPVIPTKCPHLLMVRISVFHADNASSTLAGDTKSICRAGCLRSSYKAPFPVQFRADGPKCSYGEMADAVDSKSIVQ